MFLIKNQKSYYYDSGNYCGHAQNAKGDIYTAAKYIKELEKMEGTVLPKNKVVFATTKLMVMKKGEKELNQILE